MSNPLLKQHTFPPFPEIKAAHIVPAISSILGQARIRIDELLDAPDPDYQSLVQVREELEDRLNQTWSLVTHLNSVASTTAIRDAHAECLALLSEYQTDMGQNERLFKAYQRIKASPEAGLLTVAERRVVSNSLREFRLSGVGLSEDKKQEFSDLAKKLSSLNADFRNNVLDATQAWTRLIKEPDILAGISANSLSLMQQTAAERDEQGWLLTLDAPCYLAVMNYCDNAELREEIYRAFGTRASDEGPHAGEFDNSDVMREILTTRAAMAALLGFDNFAEVSLARKMAASVADVLGFLGELAARSKPYAEREYEELRQYAEQQHGVTTLNPWDIPYYSEKLKQDRFNVSEETLRPWFPAPVVISGMFEVVRRLYDIEIRPDPTMPVWHDAVMTYVIERSGEPLARFYLDLYARTNKQGGAWMADCRVRRITLDGQLQLPVAFLTCNFTGPVGNNPALLSHDEVVTLFHEFGHGLHHMLTCITSAEVSGINGVAWDAIELPSQFMENFCWQPASLRLISGRYQRGDQRDDQRGDPLPDDMLEKVIRARNFQSAMKMVRQLELGLFDFRLHVEFDPERSDQIQALINAVREEVAVVKPPPDHRFQHGFSHIFGGGYAAGYYGYKWAEVLSADAFSKFLEDGLFNRQTGEKFLSTILGKGGSEDAMDLFVAFRGRKPEINALLEQSGLAA